MPRRKARRSRIPQTASLYGVESQAHISQSGPARHLHKLVVFWALTLPCGHLQTEMKARAPLGGARREGARQTLSAQLRRTKTPCHCEVPVPVPAISAEPNRLESNGSPQALAPRIRTILLRNGPTYHHDRRVARRAARAPPRWPAQVPALHRPEGRHIGVLRPIAADVACDAP